MSGNVVRIVRIPRIIFDYERGGTNIDFNFSPPEIYKVEREMAIATQNSSMCDPNGDLLYYSNGCFISNFQNNQILNGDSLNPGLIHNNLCSLGYETSQSMISIPTNKPNKYVMLHQAIGIQEKPKLIIATDKLYYTRIDMNANGGLGEAKEKNIVLFSGFDLPGGELTAVKNDSATGWWIICPTSKKNLCARGLPSCTNGIDQSEPSPCQQRHRHCLLQSFLVNVKMWRPFVWPPMSTVPVSSTLGNASLVGPQMQVFKIGRSMVLSKTVFLWNFLLLLDSSTFLFLAFSLE